MDPIKNFNEIKSRLQKTLSQSQNEPLNMLINQNLKLLNSKESFNKVKRNSQQNCHQLNQLKTSQKPIIRISPQIHNDQYQHQSLGQLTPKSINFCDQTRLNMTSIPDTKSEKDLVQSPIKKQKDNFFQYKKQILALNQSLNKYRLNNEEYNCEIDKLRCQKVEYEQIVFELKMNNEQLKNQILHLKRQLKNMRQHRQNCKDKFKIQSEFFNEKIFDNIKLSNPPTLQKDQHLSLNDVQLLKKYKTDSIQTNKQPMSNIQDLQIILSQMKSKISKYEKQMAQKQTLYNHQFYLLQKLKNQHHQLNNNQSSLLQELEYVLTKNKKLKKQNQQFKVQNQQRARKIIALEQANSQFETDISELFWKINQLEKQKSQIEQKLQDTTKDTKQAQSQTNLCVQGNNNNEIYSPLKLTQHFQKQINQSQIQEINIFKSCYFKIFNVINVQILPQKSQSRQIQMQGSQFLKSVELDEIYFFNQIQEKRLHIIQLQQELNESQYKQEQIQLQLQQVKLKLHNLLKQLHSLAIQHQGMKKFYQQEKVIYQNRIKQKQNKLIESLNIIEQYKKKQINQKSTN